jgi:hypothetical protein
MYFHRDDLAVFFGFWVYDYGFVTSSCIYLSIRLQRAHLILTGKQNLKLDRALGFGFTS